MTTKRTKKVLLNFLVALMLGVGYSLGYFYAFRIHDWIYYVVGGIAGLALAWGKEFLYEGLKKLHPDVEDFWALLLGFYLGTGLGVLL